MQKQVNLIMEKVRDLKFQKGALQVTDPKLQVFLCFNKSNEGSELYIALEKAIPKIKGLKRPMNRAVFTIALMSEMKRQKIKISI